MEEKKVKDLMLSLSEYATISAESTILEALRALDKAQFGLSQDRHFHRAVLVLDEDGRVIGKLSHWAVLRSLEPRLLKKGDLLSLHRAGLSQELIESLEKEITSWFTPSLEQMCREAAKTKARDAMVPVGESIDEEAPLAMAIHRLVQTHTQSMPVTREDTGDVVGVLRLTDVFEEVADLIKKG